MVSNPHEFRPASRLLVPPYWGEFGWELMNWQGRIRWLLHEAGAENVVVTYGAGRALIYRDLAHHADRHAELREISIDALPGDANEDRRVDECGRTIPIKQLQDATLDALQRSEIAVDDAMILWPDGCGRLWPCDARAQRFVDWSQPRLTEFDVLLVPRARQLAPQRSLPDEWWRLLAERLTAVGLRVTWYEPPIERAVDLLARSRLAAGGSTGGLHLASLCGCPHYVWGPGAAHRWTTIGMTNRQRYETIWNPRGTPVRYDPIGWQPTIEQAASGIVSALHEIGRGAGGRLPAATRRLQWAARRQVARLWARSAYEGWMPWRIRELARGWRV
ncbi:MAG: hypothetical protein L6Q92_11340 [Phycisphaerae bacterium]|nr:hypothetical protein [Phycisphaerae bacterium]